MLARTRLSQITYIAAGTESPHVAYFGDWMATAAALAQVTPPAGIDSISFVPTLRGHPDQQPEHEFLYWEFHEGGFRQATLYRGRWKGIRTGSPDAPVQLYDTETDIAEVHDAAKQYPEIAATIGIWLQSARTEIPAWEPKWESAKHAEK